jgi:hypothetical protein
MATTAVQIRVLGFFIGFFFFAVMWLSLFGDFPLGLAAMGRGFEGTLAG